MAAFLGRQYKGILGTGSALGQEGIILPSSAAPAPTYLLDTYTGAAAAYSVRRLSSSYSGSALRVRRSSDNAEQDIGFNGGDLDTNTLEEFVNVSAPLLDTYSGAAAAYSVRKLSSTYSGSALRVRRSSDNAEQDIGFVGNDLDTTTMESFCGAGDGFVVTWYDQSGNGNDATQSTAASQPQIVSSGSTITTNSKASITFATDSLSTSSFNLTANEIFSSWVGDPNSGANNRSIYRMRPLGAFGTVDGFAHEQDSANIFGDLTLLEGGAGNAIRSTNQGGLTASQQLVSLDFQQSEILGYVDGSLAATINTVASGSTPVGVIDVTYQLDIGHITGAGYNYSGEMQELVIWPADQSANRTAIEQNINNYFSIYTQDNDGFVVTWYDQSGNGNDATNATAADQPQIVASGSALTIGGKPTLNYDGTDDNLVASPTTVTVETTTSFCVFSADVNNQDSVVFQINETGTSDYAILGLGGLGTGAAYGSRYRDDSGTVQASGGVLDTTTIKLISMQTATTPSLTTYLNGNSPTSTDGSRIIGGTNKIIFGGNLSFPFNGNMSEFVFYDTDQSSNRTAIETDINTYYTIYDNYDPDAVAYFTAAGITDTTEKNAVNQLVLDFKGGAGCLTPSGTNLWTNAAAIWPVSPTSLDAAKYNLRDTTSFNYTWVNSPTHASTGVTFDGTTQYGDTNLSPSSLTLANSYDITLCVQIANGDASSVGLLAGRYGTVSAERTQMFLSSGSLIQDIHAGGTARLTTTTSGTYNGRFVATADRIANGGKANYLNGSSLGTLNTQDNGNPYTYNIFTGAQNAQNSPTPNTVNYSDFEYRFGCVLKEGLNSTKVADLDDAIVRYSTALSRNI